MMQLLPLALYHCMLWACNHLYTALRALQCCVMGCAVLCCVVVLVGLAGFCPIPAGAHSHIKGGLFFWLLASFGCAQPREKRRVQRTPPSFGGGGHAPKRCAQIRRRW